MYGKRVNQSFIAGPEVGVNFYLQKKMFLTLQLEYQFSLEDVSQSDGTFNNGKLVYTLGTGFNF